MPGASFKGEFNALEKVVFSKTLARTLGTWNEGRLVRGSAVDEVTKLKQQSGKDR